MTKRRKSSAAAEILVIHWGGPYDKIFFAERGSPRPQCFSTRFFFVILFGSRIFRKNVRGENAGEARVSGGGAKKVEKFLIFRPIFKNGGLRKRPKKQRRSGFSRLRGKIDFWKKIFGVFLKNGEKAVPHCFFGDLLTFLRNAKFAIQTKEINGKFGKKYFCF